MRESESVAVREGPDSPGRHALTGRDVGGRNRDCNPRRCGALIVSNHPALCAGQPNWDKLRNSIKNAASCCAFLSALVALQMVDSLAAPTGQALDLGRQDTLRVDAGRSLRPLSACRPLIAGRGIPLGIEGRDLAL